MAASCLYSEIAMNRALKTMGLNGTKRPDVIGIARDGMHKLVEVVSPRQTIESVNRKMDIMRSMNENTVGRVVKWVRRLFF